MRNSAWNNLQSMKVAREHHAVHCICMLLVFLPLLVGTPNIAGGGSGKELLYPRPHVASIAAAWLPKLWKTFSKPKPSSTITRLWFVKFYSCVVKGLHQSNYLLLYNSMVTSCQTLVPF